MRETIIVTGAYGSGKTEFCVNLALRFREESREKISIADLDVINPYFRSREKIDYLQQFDIEILGNSLPGKRGIDLPAVSFGFLPHVQRGERLIIDLAGGPAGLNLLAGLYERLGAHDFLCVLNSYRPETNSKEKMLRFIRQTHDAGRLRVTGLVNNSHMIHETGPAHVLAGQEMILAVSKELDIPLVYTQLKRSVYEEIKDEIKSENLLIFEKLQMRETWQ